MKTGQESDLISLTTLLKRIDEDKADMLMKEYYKELYEELPSGSFRDYIVTRINLIGEL